MIRDLGVYGDFISILLRCVYKILIPTLSSSGANVSPSYHPLLHSLPILILFVKESCIHDRLYLRLGII
jgi:hypothetical protein